MSQRLVYTLTYLALMVLLALTLGLAYVDLGPLNVPVALLIATIKAVLVGLFFMHLRKSDGLHRLAALAGVFWLGILLSLSLSDYLTRGRLKLPAPWPLRDAGSAALYSRD